MATSAFKSTTRRGDHSTTTTTTTTARRSRSLSRFSRPIGRRLDDDDTKKGVPAAGFGEAARGTPITQFPEISLDDLALEFFSSSSSWNDNGSDGGIVQERQGRSRRVGEIGRWASETASSRRKSRSVSRTRGGGEASSTRPPAPQVRERNAGSSSGGGQRRRRSLSVSRQQQIGDYDNSSDRSIVKAPASGNRQIPMVQKVTTSSNRRLRRSQSYKDLHMSQDGYSSHSSALTDDESKDARIGRNGFEKTIQPVYSQKRREPLTEDAADGGLYEVMRQELRHAVEEIRTELNQAMSRNQTALPVGHSLQTYDSENFEEFSGIRNKYSTKLEQSEKSKQNFPDSKTSSVVKKPSRSRKRSSDRHRVSRRLIEEAEKYFEGFISNVEDTDLSSFDGERSDGSSTLGGRRRPKDSATRTTTTLQSSIASNSCTSEMEGVLFPWLEWETSHDGSSSATTKMQTPVTPKVLRWDSDKDDGSLRDPPSNHSRSRQGSWSPAVLTNRGKDGTSSGYEVDEYLNLKKKEEMMLEVHIERNQINRGGMLICTSFPLSDDGFLML